MIFPMLKSAYEPLRYLFDQVCEGYRAGFFKDGRLS